MRKCIAKFSHTAHEQCEILKRFKEQHSPKKRRQKIWLKRSYRLTSRLTASREFIAFSGREEKRFGKKRVGKVEKSDRKNESGVRRRDKDNRGIFAVKLFGFCLTARRDILHYIMLSLSGLILLDVVKLFLYVLANIADFVQYGIGVI